MAPRTVCPVRSDQAFDPVAMKQPHEWRAVSYTVRLMNETDRLSYYCIWCLEMLDAMEARGYNQSVSEPSATTAG